MCLNVSKQQFSADVADKAANVCLAHLFTYQDFDEGTLGLAYVAPSKPDIAGGLCSKGTTLGISAVSFSCLFFLNLCDMSADGMQSCQWIAVN